MSDVHGLPLFARPAVPEPDGSWSEAEVRTLEVLMHCMGRARARKAPELARDAGFGEDTRSLQKTVHDLIHDRGVPVGSAMSDPYGYYLAETDAELEEVAERFYRRALSIMSTGAKLRWIGGEAMMRRIQTELGLEEEQAA